MSVPQQFPRLAASACVFRNGEVLLVQRSRAPNPGDWGLPGGHVEPGETAQAAARRELAEETGIIADLAHLVGIFDIVQRDDHGVVSAHYAIACYAGFWQSGEAEAASDALSVRWVLPAALSGFPLAPNVMAAIGNARLLLNL